VVGKVLSGCCTFCCIDHGSIWTIRSAWSVKAGHAMPGVVVGLPLGDAPAHRTAGARHLYRLSRLR